MPADPSDPSVDDSSVDVSSVDTMIEALVRDLAPVAPLRLWRGVGAGLAATVFAAGGVWLTLGFRADIVAGHPPAIVVLRSSVLLLAGMVMLLAAVRAAVPGRADQGASMAGALLLGLFPLGLMALLLQGIMAGRTPSFAEVGAFSAARCFAIAIASALLVGGAIVAWMRRAAPTDLGRAGWLAGWAAGALGTFAYSLFCPASSPGFVTTVYPAAMFIVAGLARLAVPRLVRW